MQYPFAFVSMLSSSVSACRASTPARYAKRAASAGAAVALLALSGCYYYAPYGYAPYSSYSPYYAGAVPAAGTQQETSVYQTQQSAQSTWTAAPNPAPAAIPDAQYPGSLTATPPVVVAAPVWPVWPAYYPAYPAWPAYYSYPAWGWGAPSISFGFGYWGGGGHWHR